MSNITDDKEKTGKSNKIAKICAGVLSLIATVMIYFFVIRIIIAFGLTIVQNVASGTVQSNDPLILLVFSATLSSTLIGVFIAKVHVFTMIQKGFMKLFSYASSASKKRDAKKSKNTNKSNRVAKFRKKGIK